MSTSKLFEPIKVGNVVLKHRAVLAPLTRFRGDGDHVPTMPLVKEYYSQRASVPGTMLVSEGVFIHAKAGGYPNAPGIWSDAQIAAWKEIVDAVHKNGSSIFIQLWALGRAAYPQALTAEDASYPFVSASDIPLSDRPDGPAPRPLSEEEVKEYVQWYTQAAKNAVEGAGFDGVEIHNANGYLLDQFVQDVSNKRTDAYGGSIENRSRFTLEVVDSVVKAIGPRKTGIRFSPWGTFQDMGMEDPKPQFSHLLSEIKKAHPTLAFVHVVEYRSQGFEILKDSELPTGKDNEFIRDIWTRGEGGNDSEDGRRLISAGGYTLENAMKTAEEKGDIIAFGRSFLANPDLPYRLRHNIELNPYDRDTFYTPGNAPKGYTDYPFASKVAAVKA